MGAKHVLYLDSLRGLACMVVVLTHSIGIMYPGIFLGTYKGESINYHNFLYYPPCSLLVAGLAAVCLFFILSGFVLSYRFMGEGDMKWKIIEAIVKRPIRLGGIILFTMLPLFSFLLTKDFWCGRALIDYDLCIITVWHAVTNTLSMNAYMYNPPLWTINAELWGSFLTFALCFFIGSFNKYIRLVIMIGAVAYFINTFYIAFVFGMIVADVHKNWRINWFIKNSKIIAWTILIPAVICCSYTYRSNADQYLGEIPFLKLGYLMLGAMLLFIFVICNDKIKRILEIRPLVFIGGISYSIYVLHWFILERYICKINYYFITTFWSNIYLSFVATFIISTTIIIIASWLVDMCVDKPCIWFSTWFAKGLISEIQNKILWIKNFKRKPEAVIPETITASAAGSAEIQAEELSSFSVRQED